MIDVGEISRRLSDDAEAVASYLLPGGQVHGREFVAGSVAGEKGKSLKVVLSGTKQGVWCDFATGETGDLIDLWMATMAMSKGEAVKAAKEWLGIEEEVRPRVVGKKAEKFAKADTTGVKKMSTGGVVENYLASRGITRETMALYRVAEADSFAGVSSKTGKPYKLKGPWIVWGSMVAPDSKELASIKFLHVEKKEGKKQIISPGAQRPTLFGWQAIDQDSRTLTICEGEIDAMTLWQYGFPAVSVPSGGGKGNKQQWIDYEWENLTLYDEIYVVMDMDTEGALAVEEIVNRLGSHRCKIVELPCKDANECWQEGVSNEEVSKRFAEANFAKPQEVRTATELTAEVMEYFFPSRGELPGYDLPWSAKGVAPVRIMPGQMSIWTGINGHGKSQILNQVALTGCAEGFPTLIASFEMQAGLTLQRAVCQSSGVGEPSKPLIMGCLDWLDEVGLSIYDHKGVVDTDRLLSVLEFAYRRGGVKQVVIDSLMRCGIREDDYQAQKDFVDTLLTFCDETGLHIHLVAHSRKRESEDASPGKMDVKGAGSLTDLTWNLFSVWRNKQKAVMLAELKAGIKVKGETEESVKKKCDAVLSVDKCRYDGQREGRIPLMFHADSGLYYQSYKQRPTVLYDYNDQAVAEEADGLPRGF